MAFWVSGRVGGSSSASFVGTWGRRLMASSLVAEGRFKTQYVPVCAEDGGMVLMT